MNAFQSATGFHPEQILPPSYTLTTCSYTAIVIGTITIDSAKIVPTLSNLFIETPEYLSDDAKGCAIDLIDQLDDLGDKFSNLSSVTDNQNNNISTESTTIFWDLPDQTTSPLVQNSSWDPECSQVFISEPTKQAGSKRKSPSLTSDSDKVEAIFLVFFEMSLPQ